MNRPRPRPARLVHAGWYADLAPGEAAVLRAAGLIRACRECPREAGLAVYHPVDGAGWAEVVACLKTYGF